MPTPRDNETRKQWMKRCVPVLIEEGNEQDQAVAVCSNIWRNRNKMYSVKSNFRLKDVDDQKGIISAYVSVFDNVDTDGDMIVKGAFAKTIKERGPQAPRARIKHLWMHNPWEVIGVPEEMKEDNEGLLVRSRFGSDNFSKDKLQQHIDGLIDEFSIGYEIIGSEKVESDAPYQKLTEIKLWEYSSVTWGANELTRRVDGKGNMKEKLEWINERMDKLTVALRKGKYTDESAELFEIELKQIQTIYNDLIQSDGPSSDTHDRPSNDTLQDKEIEEILKSFKNDN